MVSRVDLNNSVLPWINLSCRMKVAVLLNQRRDGVLPTQQHEAVQAAYAQCVKLAEEERMFMQQTLGA